MKVKCFAVFVLSAFSVGAFAASDLGMTDWRDRAASDLLFAAKNATEAVLTFSHQVKFRHRNAPTEAQAREQIANQLQHLHGPLSAARFPGAPKEDQRITHLKVGGVPGDFVIAYRYTGTMVIGNGASSTYQLILPVDPERIYRAGFIKRNGEEYNPCTDDHYQTEGDFWYFWNPHQKGCKLKEGVDFNTVLAKVHRIKNTVETYPEYDRMVDADGVIRISILLGMDEPDEKKNPLRSEDVNATNYRILRRDLVKTGFAARKLTRAEIYGVVPRGTSPLPFVEEFEKRNRRGIIRIRVFYGPSGITEKSRGFHFFFKDALEHSAIMIYEGHSGLGGNLDIAAIEEMERFKFSVPLNKYQMYFFDSCSSYTYYNTLFFSMKANGQDRRGTRNLDILANGLSTTFSSMERSTRALIGAVDAWTQDKPAPSYQALAKAIDSNNLFTINGDEDNPTRMR